MSDFSEFRQNIVSGDWVLIAPGRAKRSAETFRRQKKRLYTSKFRCPFERLRGMSPEAPYLQYGEGVRWRLVVVENKYPALTHREVCPVDYAIGPYHAKMGSGHHELLVTHSHTNNFADLPSRLAEDVFKAFVERYRALAKDPCVPYISILQNWGALAGASQSHPHYQILALPVVPPEVVHSVSNAGHYFKTRRGCAYCTMISWEHKQKTRLIYENSGALVVAPYASKHSYELRVYPKQHESFFEYTSANTLAAVVDALQKALQALRSLLADPDYNFFIHTAPIDGSPRSGGTGKATDRFYHWHIEVLPKTNISAGFELGTGIIINPVDPDKAAALLRKAM